MFAGSGPEREAVARNLRVRVFRAGAHLALRQLAGMALGVVGLLLLTRSIGAAAYGTYAAALGVNLFTLLLAQLGIPVYLVRKPGRLTHEDCDQGFCLLIASGAALLMVLLPSLGLLERWVRIDGFAPVQAAVLAGLPLQLAALVPLARLERELSFGRIAIVELAAQGAFYVIALPLALLQFGVWAPVLGWWSQQVLTVAWLHRLARYRPRFLWSRELRKPMLDYGFGYSASVWVWQLRKLVNPLLVSRLLGAEAVGLVALATRLTESLGFAKSVIWRLSITALSRIQDDASRLRQTVSEGMLVQVFTVGPPLLAFTLAGPWLIRLVYDSTWLGVLQVYPFIAAGFLFNALFSLHSSTLYVLRRNLDVAVYHIVHVLLFAGAVVVLAPSAGILSYGFAEVIALLSYVLIHLYLQRATGKPDYALPLTAASVIGLAMYWRILGWPAALGLLWLIFSPTLWKRARDYYVELRSAVYVSNVG